MTIRRSFAAVCLLLSTGLHFKLASQVAPSAVASQSLPQTAVGLQRCLDEFSYGAYAKAMAAADASQLTAPQRQYFLGMLAFHLGKLDEGAQYLLTAINTNRDGSLTANQVESALEALGQINLKLTYYGASAKVYDDIDKAFGTQLGEAEHGIREKRQLAFLLRTVPKQTFQISADFTIPRTGLEYQISIPNLPLPAKPLFAQFDTGSEVSILSASTAKAWKVTLLDGTATLQGYAGGTFAAQPGYIPVLMIGKAELRNVAVYVTADENLYIPQIKRQTNALLGYSVVATLGRLTFSKDGSLTVSAQSPSRDLRTSAPLWIAGHTILVELGTRAILSEGKVSGVNDPRLFMLDTGSGSTWFTDRYLAEHTGVYHGPPPSVARLAGADGLHEIPAYVAHLVPLFAGNTETLINGPHILARPVEGEAERYFGLIGQDTLGSFSSYTIDLRNMTFTVTP